MRVLFLILTIIIITTTSALPDLLQQWEDFKVTHNKSYRTYSEDAAHFKIFSDNINEIEEHNARFAAGEVTYKKAINYFGDMTDEEFISFVNGGKAISNPKKYGKLFIPSDIPLSSEVDWRKLRAVTEVKNQGACSASWNFAVTGTLEGQLAIQNGTLISLSEQNLIDCSFEYGDGCDFGDISLAYDYVHESGIESEVDYPYEESDGPCRFDPSKSVIKTISGFYDIPSGDELSLQRGISQYGPIGVIINATPALRFYSGGYFYDPDCDSKNLNHSLLVVGYGTDENGDYWILKNSWGITWGDEGYVYLARNAGNHCGIASAATCPEL